MSQTVRGRGPLISAVVAAVLIIPAIALIPVALIDLISALVWWLVLEIVIGTFVGLIVLAVVCLRAPRDRRDILGVIAVSGAVWLVPATAVVLARLSMFGCSVINLLGLPWPPAVRAVVIIVGIAILGITVAGIVWAARSDRRRLVLLPWVVYLAAMALPALFGLFIMVYGDPAPGCVPG